jgi:DNA-nicking Smr family endonuclease
MPKDSLSDEDKALFRQMMRDVEPLSKSQKVELPTPQKKMPKPQRQEKSEAPKTDFYLSDFYAEEVEAATILAYFTESIPNKRKRELKNGLIPWESRLDLHGLKPEAARLALIRFIQSEAELAHRCLLIIHGKGSHQGEAPVLKNLVNRWLPQFPQVLAFHSALPRDGGPGALYLLLKKANTKQYNR